MKHVHLPQIFIFLVSLLVGHYGGTQHAMATTINLHRTPHQATHPAVFPMLPADQVSFLIIKVAVLDAAQPQLENLWWLLHKRQGAINLVSIFPSLSEDHQADSDLKSQFAILKDEQGYQLTPAFEQYLESLNLTWQGYLIVDEVAFRHLLGDPPRVTERLSAPLPFPQPAQQLIQWRLFCRKSLQSAWQEPMQNPWIRAMEGQHLSFGSPTAYGLQIWHQLMSDTPINTCTFPVLDNQINY